jgi:diphosphate--fructose-6-phosphate 1-phosphotransferase
VVGFIGGVSGLIGNHTVQVTPELLAPYRGGGGFELLGRSTDNLTKEDFPAVLSTVQGLGLDGLVLLGGSRTNTAAAYLSEYLFANGSSVNVVTTPVDLSNSIKNEFVETAVGFDTACKVAGQIAGNNATDGASAKKYWYFMRVMGQQHSHSTLEVALQTKPNYVILSEEVRAKNMTLADIVRSIADVVAARAKVRRAYTLVSEDNVITL